jgi:hypothetical protein
MEAPASTAPGASSSDDGEVRPFSIEFRGEALDDLRGRIEATRLPSKETVEDYTQGVQLAPIKGEIFRAPRGWAERVYPKLVYFNEVDRGGHFAAWEEPDLFAEEMRAAFRSLR